MISKDYIFDSKNNKTLAHHYSGVNKVLEETFQYDFDSNNNNI